MSNNPLDIEYSSDTDESVMSTNSYYSDEEILPEEYEIRKNNITYIENNQEMFDNDDIAIPLYPYQKRSLKVMIDRENTGLIDNISYGGEKNHIRCLNIPDSMAIINTNISIYNDELKIKIPLGKYKSNIELEDEKTIEIDRILTIIALIKYNRIVKNNNDLIKKAISGTSISLIIEKPLLQQTLIIIEHSECDNIVEKFNKYCPELKIYLISTQKHNDNIVIGSWFDDGEWNEDRTKIINREELIEDEIKEYDVIICSHILYYRFYQSVKNYIWNRIVIVDCDKYNLPFKLETYFNFMWFVISNTNDLYGEKPYISKIFGKINDDKKGIMDYLIVKNRMEDIKYEMDL